MGDANVEQLVALWKECGLTRAWNDPYRNIQFARSGCTSTVPAGEQDGKIVASVMVGHDGHRGGLYYLAVSAVLQARGLGKAMYAQAVSWFGQLCVWRINLMVRAEDKGVVGFYESLGYEVNRVLSLGKYIE